jgi:hypothetical protein
MAQTYFTRASLLIHLSEDKATLLAYKLCQVSARVLGGDTDELIVCNSVLRLVSSTLAGVSTRLPANITN